MKKFISIIALFLFLPVYGENSMTMKLSSPAFSSNEMIPPQYTCKGEDISPALQWTDIPPGTQSLALMVDDPDAPGGTWNHWMLYNLPPSTNDLPQHTTFKTLPQGAIEGLNSWREPGYRGPCPPSGTHHYHFKLFALDTVLLPLDYPTQPGLLEAMKGHIIAEAELVGLFGE